MSDFRVIFKPKEYERSVAFYEHVLGFPVVAAWDEPGDRGTIFRAGPGTIELLALTNMAAPSGFRLAVLVDDPDALCAEVRSRGAAVLEDPVDRPWGYREFVVADPDEVAVALYRVSDPAAAGHP